MLLGAVALSLASAFCGAATYINIAEHPARMLLDDRSALAQWRPSYAKAFNFQGGLAVFSGLAGHAKLLEQMFCIDAISAIAIQRDRTR